MSAVADPDRDLREIAIQPPDHHIDPGGPFVMVVRFGEHRRHLIVGVQVGIVDISAGAVALPGTLSGGWQTGALQ